MAFKFVDAAHDRCRKINGPQHIALVHTGPHFEKGRLIENPTNEATA